VSIKNKATDRDERGRIARKYTGHGCHSHPMGTPGWWISLHMIRPARRTSRALCRALVRGEIDPDEVVFPLGSQKPHEYFW